MDDLFLYTRYSSTKELQLRTGTGVIVFKPPNPKEKKKKRVYLEQQQLTIDMRIYFHSCLMKDARDR
jgi:hypothetical protein